jgi:hypothetical protein
MGIHFAVQCPYLPVAVVIGTCCERASRRRFQAACLFGKLPGVWSLTAEVFAWGDLGRVPDDIARSNMSMNGGRIRQEAGPEGRT